MDQTSDIQKGRDQDYTEDGGLIPPHPHVFMAGTTLPVFTFSLHCRLEGRRRSLSAILKKMLSFFCGNEQ
jgi:hypothetical protein